MVRCRARSARPESGRGVPSGWRQRAAGCGRTCTNKDRRFEGPMLAAIAILLFLIIALVVFAVFAAFDQRNAHARLLRERLAAIDQAQTRAPSEELAMLRDGLLSGIPAP